jgi:lipopolysaccharide/colanic/teichoic acid biosynthesis glycosyltransferase
MKIISLLQKKNSGKSYAQDYTGHCLNLKNPDTDLYSENFFVEFLRLEQKRSERSCRPFMLVVIRLKGFSRPSEKREIVKDIANVLSSSTRDTDIKGWYKHNDAIGIIFNDISSKSHNFQADQQSTLNKVYGNLKKYLGLARFDRLGLSYQVFPRDFVVLSKAKSGDMNQHPNLVSPLPAKKTAFAIKRAIDIIGSFSAIVLFAPVFLLVAVLIKMNSSGGVFFKEERVGLYGKKFMFLKFRSTYNNNGSTLHKESVRNLVQEGKAVDRIKSVGAQYVNDFKTQDDSRVTSIGRFLRKTYIDELPQFFNVLKGEMSLVGPTPSISKGCEDYDMWHKSRALDMKPGITGLWQVDGHSLTFYSDMVHMDIKYIREWSLLLDIKILYKTVFAALTYKGVN